MNRKKGVLLFVAIFLLSFSVSAKPFDIKFDIVENAITLGQPAVFNLTITNNLNREEAFRVKTLDYPTWDISTQPLMNPILVDIKPLKSKTIKILLRPLSVTSLGVYDVTVIVKQESGKNGIEIPLRVNLVSPTAGKYVETVIATIVMEDKIDPTKIIPIKIKLDNQNIIKYPELELKIDSALIKEEIKESLGSKEKKTIELKKEIDPQTKPQEDVVVVTVLTGNVTLDTKIKRIEIIGHRELKKEERIKERFLKTIKQITYRNVGNVPYKDTVKIKSTFFQSLFTSSKPKGKFVKEDDVKYLVWDVDIPPGGSLGLEVVHNYITILFIIVLLIVVVFLYYTFRSPLVINKKAANVAFKEGGVSELKIVLNVRNRGNSILRNIVVIDRIPNIADVEKGITIGTLQPTKILKHEKKGTLIKWMIDNIEPGDERVISYKIRSHLSILGEFTLIAAVGKFRAKGREIITHSNSLSVSP